MRLFWGKPAARRRWWALWACLGVAAPAGLYAQSYVISTVAGGSPAPATAAATSTVIGMPGRVRLDSAGNVYFTALNSVFKLSSGVLTRVAGNGRPGYSGDGGPATSAQLNGPQGIAFDSAGDMYIADTLNQVVRMVAASSGNITTVAGNGTPGLDGDYGQATQAVLHLPTAVAVDASGNLYICDSANNAIREVTNGLMIPYLGNYIQGYAGDTTGQISLNNPSDIFFDGSGNLWIADYGNGRIREFGTNGIASTVVGGGSTFTENGFPLATALAGPHSVAVDSANNIYIADADDNRIFKVTASTNRITTLAGTGSYGFSGDGGAANAAPLNTPTSLALDPSGNVYFIDLYNARVRMVSSSGTLSTVAGNGGAYYSGDGGPAQNAIMNGPASVAFSSTGAYIADTVNQRIRQVSTSGIISTVAGSGAPGFSGDNGPAAKAQLFYPYGIAVDASGFLYIADTGNQRVRKVVNGTINTIAGNGTSGYSGDGSSAVNASLNAPVSLAVDSAGNVYISDFGNHVVREVSVSGIISTIAGNGTQGYSGDGAKATAAQLNGPEGLALDSSGNLYIADSGNHVVRMVTPTGAISTFAGNNGLGYSGDGGQAIQAQLATPTGLAIDSAGNLYISDSGVNVVRRVAPGGVITTVAGTGSAGYSGDGGPATQATFDAAAGIALDNAGSLYVTDAGNNVVRLLQPVSPSPSAGAVVNAASNALGPIAPGEAVTLYGSGIGPANVTSSQPDPLGNVPDQLAGTVVYVNGVPAPIVYTWTRQIGVVIPYEVTPGTARVAVKFGNQISLDLPVKIVSSAPALYTADGSGQGQALALNHDTGTINTAATPVAHGSLITLYITGAGAISPVAPDGSPNAAGLAHPLLPVTATVGGVPTTVAYAGGDNGLAPGMIRLDVSVPSDVSGSAVPVVVKVGDASTQTGVTIAVN